jgi:hypothetical protein
MTRNSAKNYTQPELAIPVGDPSGKARGVSCGTVVRRPALSRVVSSGKEFDANHVLHSPYHRALAAQPISNDQKGKLRGGLATSNAAPVSDWL